MWVGAIRVLGANTVGSKAPVCKDPTRTALFSFLQSPRLNRFQIYLEYEIPLDVFSHFLPPKSERDRWQVVLGFKGCFRSSLDCGGKMRG